MALNDFEPVGVCVFIFSHLIESDITRTIQKVPILLSIGSGK